MPTQTTVVIYHVELRACTVSTDVKSHSSKLACTATAGSQVDFLATLVGSSENSIPGNSAVILVGIRYDETSKTIDCDVSGRAQAYCCVVRTTTKRERQSIHWPIESDGGCLSSQRF